MPKKDEKRLQLIREALAGAAGAGHDAVVDQTLWPWKQLAAHLTPVIGDAGFCALYGRTVRLAMSDFSWLTAVEPAQTIDSLFLTLKEDFAATDVQSMAQANFALLERYTGLLSTLIGEMLTTRILNSAWNKGSDGKNTQEMST
ncbi:MAG: hypothetical protein JWQ23_1579 [Herminiimonas sp.]|nr:hypothetical protein [Herminiimonas sp.]